MAIDINRGTNGLVTLPAEISSEIWANTTEQSVIQTLARKIDLPAGGLQIPVITGDPEAGWVAETAEKPVSDSTFGSKTLGVYKLAVIELFSDEFARDMGAVYNALVERLPQALGRKFDQTVLGNTAPGDNFDVLGGAAEFTLDGTTKPFFGALESVSEAGGDVTGWALAPAAEIASMQINDTTGRPLLLGDLRTEGSIGSVLARPAYRARNVQVGNTVGLAGDFSQAMWGAVEGIKVDINNQGTVTKGSEQINLWQRNMFAVRAEVEVGFAVRDVNRFAKLTKAAGGAEGNG